MKKRLLVLMLALICVMLLSACGCKHETWLDADCTTPKTCADCGETEGAPLGHSWLAATCENAKTCEICGEGTGETIGHKWTDAVCDMPKRCEFCGLKEGEALGHAWVDATTEEPKTCETCGLTEGERIITDERFTTAATADIQGVWFYDAHISSDTMYGEQDVIPDYVEFDITMQYILEFRIDGTMSYRHHLPEDSGLEDFMLLMAKESLYETLEAEGYSREEADEVMMERTGMTVDEYLAQSMESMEAMDFNSILGMSAQKGVYYVEDGILYTSRSWTGYMLPTEFTLDENGLPMGRTALTEDPEIYTYTRMEN